MMSQHRISLLYVEDEKILRTIYEKILEDKIAHMYFAENGEEGFEKYLKYQPDLVITDIKMPVMNGLDMIRKIRKVNPEARIGITSAYSESHYFIRAIESGVKGFLMKPIDNQKLFDFINTQAKEILLGKAIVEEEFKRKQAETALLRNEAILQSVSDVAEILLRDGYQPASVLKIISTLGKAARVSRVYIFEVYNKDEETFCQQSFEWVADGTSQQIDNPELQSVLLSDGDFKRWGTELSCRRSIYGNIKDFPAEERGVLQAQEILSIMVIPIFVDEEWFGFIGFDDCRDERNWSVSETNTLMTAANIIGTAIQRSRTDEQLIRLNAELEERVRLRTIDLENEIVERKTAENLLRDSEEKYRLIFENANDGIFLSSNGKIQFVNPKAVESTGYQPKQVIGKIFTDFLHPDYRELVLNRHFKRLSGEQIEQSYDVQIIDANGNYKWVELKSNLISWDDSNVVLTFMTDINTRKIYEEELRVLNQSLEERVKEELERLEKQQQLLIQKSKLESLGELSAGIAHEVNQPLTGLTLSLDNILYESDNKMITDEYLRAKIRLMFEDINRIRKIIQHVREFSRDTPPSAGEIININQVINNALSFVNRLYIDHQIDLEVNMGIKHVYSTGDAFQLEQVILNMLSNARYAVEQKAEQQIPGYRKTIAVKSYGTSGMLTIEVADNGIGIPAKLVNNIFDPFFSTKKHSDGSGLGLSISYGIIKSMHGDILVDSKENEYTRLLIQLPETKNDR